MTISNDKITVNKVQNYDSSKIQEHLENEIDELAERYRIGNQNPAPIKLIKSDTEMEEKGIETNSIGFYSRRDQTVYVLLNNIENSDEEYGNRPLAAVPAHEQTHHFNRKDHLDEELETIDNSVEKLNNRTSIYFPLGEIADEIGGTIALGQIYNEFEAETEELIEEYENGTFWNDKEKQRFAKDLENIVAENRFNTFRTDVDEGFARFVNDIFYDLDESLDISIDENRSEEQLENESEEYPGSYGDIYEMLQGVKGNLDSYSDMKDKDIYNFILNDVRDAQFQKFQQ